MKHVLPCLTLALLLTGCASAAATPSPDASLVQLTPVPSMTAFLAASPTVFLSPTATGASAHTSAHTVPGSAPVSYAQTNSKTAPNSGPSPSKPSAQQPAPQQSSQQPAPQPTKAPAPTAAPKPTPMPDGAPANPWGYDFEPGTRITAPPSNFCSYYTCITNFANGKGYVVECKDAMYSLSGGISGSCSSHKGNNRELHSH